MPKNLAECAGLSSCEKAIWKHATSGMKETIITVNASEKDDTIKADPKFFGSLQAITANKDSQWFLLVILEHFKSCLTGFYQISVQHAFGPLFYKIYSKMEL